jgi:hypothetical protein
MTRPLAVLRGVPPGVGVFIEAVVVVVVGEDAAFAAPGFR